VKNEEKIWKQYTRNTTFAAPIENEAAKKRRRGRGKRESEGKETS
jgi:hypothetical protein